LLLLNSRLTSVSLWAFSRLPSEKLIEGRKKAKVMWRAAVAVGNKVWPRDRPRLHKNRPADAVSPTYRHQVTPDKPNGHKISLEHEDLV
ncbi:hypothetical protein FDENT_7791, partial [Fusarium denticulatum]